MFDSIVQLISLVINNPKSPNPERMARLIKRSGAKIGAVYIKFSKEICGYTIHN